MPDVSGPAQPQPAARAAKPLWRSYRIQQAMSRILKEPGESPRRGPRFDGQGAFQGDFCLVAAGEAAARTPELFFLPVRRAGRASGAPPTV